jgi:hypothetical protein
MSLNWNLENMPSFLSLEMNKTIFSLLMSLFKHKLKLFYSSTLIKRFRTWSVDPSHKEWASWDNIQQLRCPGMCVWHVHPTWHQNKPHCSNAFPSVGKPPNKVSNTWGPRHGLCMQIFLESETQTHLTILTSKPWISVT